MQRTSRQRDKPRKVFFFFFLGLKVPGAFYSPNMLFEGRHFQMASNQVDVETLEKILTSCFQKGMELEIPMVKSYGSRKLVVHRSVR